MISADDKNKLNNKGFSLIEVLVAIIILSVVSLPLLTAFIISANLNSKSRTTQQITSLAQNYMEMYKNTNIEAVIVSGGFDYVDTDPPGHGPSGDANNVEYRRYKYKMIKYGVDCGGTPVDVVVVASPRTVIDGEGDLMIDLSKPIITNAYSDVVRMLPYSKDQDAYNTIKHKVLDYINDNHNKLPDNSNYYDYTTDDVLMNHVEIERYIELNASDDNSDPHKPGIKISSSVKYTSKMIDYPVFDINTGSTVNVNTSLSDVLYSDAMGDDKTVYGLESVYFYYYPGYKNGNIKIKKDHVRFNNNCADDKKIKLFIYKQKNPLISDIALRNCEIGYEPEMSFNPHYEDWTTYHNFNKNLGDDSELSLSWAAPIFDHHYLSTDRMPLIHDIKIEIFKAGDISANGLLYTLEGSMDSYR